MDDTPTSNRPAPRLARHYDIVILGGGLAGQTLARHLLLETDLNILMLDRRAALPAGNQKVGESSVQLAGYYFSKVLDLEEHLLREHFMKYNLRFYWPSRDGNPADFADYSQAYIRKFSNIASYQLDRNKLEAEVLRRNLESPRFTLALQSKRLDVELSEGAREPHRVRFALGDGNGGRLRSVTADWFLDCSGRGRYLATKLGLKRDNRVRHGASFLWVDGLVNIEKLTEQTPRELRLNRDRAHVGHLPLWLATNHFCGQGFWFWVIPLQGITSFGLVYDRAEIPREEVAGAEKLVEWVCKRFPLFARELEGRPIRDYAAYIDFSHDCVRTLSGDRWAMSGEAGRFSDPLYSPGSDLISLHNTMIVDAVKTGDPDELAGKARASEQLLRSLYDAYLPTFYASYDALGDPEAFTLKYSWELAVYFAFYVFPFINDLFTDRRFVLSFLNRFARLGPLNHNVQKVLSAFYRWKKAEGRVGTAAPVFVDFLSIGPLAKTERTFYQVGLSTDEAKKVLGQQLANLSEMARFVMAYVCAAVVGDAGALTNASFIATLDPAGFEFDPEEIRRRWHRHAADGAQHPWSFDPWVLEAFRQASPAGAGAEGMAHSLAGAGQAGAG
jgi:flavin-dependent dehydrogenase